MPSFSAQQAREAVARHSTLFFDSALQPVVPIVGQWFCEFDVYDTADGQEFARDEALVEFLGGHHVAPEGDYDDERRPSGLLLVLQA